MPLLIGITGNKSNGKDTIANYLVLRYKFLSTSVAKPLKDGLKPLFCFSDEQLNDPVLKETIDSRWGVSPRTVLQKFGTDIMRDNISDIIPGIGSNFWVKRLEMELDKMKEEKIVVSDIRFPNEIEMIKRRGGIIIAVERNNVGNGTDKHKSETSIDFSQADIVIQNNSSLKDLYEKVDTFVKTIM